MTEKSFAFARPSSGLVREFTQGYTGFFNAVWPFMAVPVSLPGYYSMATLLFPHANLPLAILISVVMGIPPIVAYGLMMSAMPRSSGDYVWVSRTINSVLGIVVGFMFAVIFCPWLTFNGWVFATTGVSTLLNGFGFVEASAWASSGIGLEILTAVGTIGPLAIIVWGIKRTGQIGIFVAILALIVNLTMISMLLSLDRSSLISGFNAMMGAGAYQNFIDTAKAAGWTGILPFGEPYNAYDTMVVGAMGASGITIFAWAALPLVGEIKNAERAKSNIFMMFIPLVVAAVLVSVYFTLYTSLASEIHTAIFYLGNEGNELVDTLPFYWAFTSTYLPGMALGESALSLVSVVVGVGFSFGALYSNSMNNVLPVRYIFAMAFDGVLPRKLAYVHPRFHIPLVGYLVLAAGGLVWQTMTYFYPAFWHYWAFMVAGQAALWFCGCLSATVFPYRLKSVYKASPAAKYVVGGIPLITVAGILGVISMGWFIAVNLGVPELGGTQNVPTLVALGIFAAIVYFAFKYYRMRTEGIDISLAFREIPPE